ncbi:hypothetical protein Sjap_020704 [Stephania japonica]|uniref:Uncharacterized protein n=1 Tax=Stephania japonica TaxID=461633 RepID=A0AAP0F175_9MAGN
MKVSAAIVIVILALTAASMEIVRCDEMASTYHNSIEGDLRSSLLTADCQHRDTCPQCAKGCVCWVKLVFGKQLQGLESEFTHPTTKLKQEEIRMLKISKETQVPITFLESINRKLNIAFDDQRVCTKFNTAGESNSKQGKHLDPLDGRQWLGFRRLALRWVILCVIVQHEEQLSPSHYPTRWCSSPSVLEKIKNIEAMFLRDKPHWWLGGRVASGARRAGIEDIVLASARRGFIFKSFSWSKLCHPPHPVGFPTQPRF